jgi:predicted transcriptional regulator
MRYSSLKKIFDTLTGLRCERDSKARFNNLILRDIYHTPVVYAKIDEPLRLVAARMIENGFSQLPVQEGDRLVGTVTESSINRAIMNRSVERAGELTVEDVLEAPLPVLDEGLCVSTVVELIHLNQAVLSVSRGVVVGIVTNTDLYGHVFEDLSKSP